MKIQLLILILILILILTTIVEAQKPDDGDAWEATNANVSPSMAIVVIVLVLGFFITGCIFIYIQHCVVDTSSTATTTNNNNNNNLIKRGLDQSVIDTFPQFKYSAVKELKIGKGALECAVCLSEFDNDQTLLRLLPKCDHVFHSECIDSWLVGHATCPVCRDNLLAVAVPEETRNDEVQITINDQETTDNKKRVRLPRSHSTGHSMVQQVENSERYTLRLPAEVRRQLMARAHLHATSMVALPRQSSSRRGYRAAAAGGDGSSSSRYGRFFGRSFILRMGSFKSTTAKLVDHGDFTNTCSAAVATPPQINASFPPPLPV